MFLGARGPGDHETIEGSLGWDDEPDVMHLVDFALCDIAQKHDDPRLSKSLTWLCEKAACTHCRAKTAEQLVSWDTAPRWLAEGCLFDCSQQIRDIASQASSSDKQTCSARIRYSAARRIGI